MHDERRHEWALFRVAVLGPLVSAKLEHGDVRALCEAAAARRWETPDGRLVKLSWRTIERWYYAHRRGGFDALRPGTRKDAGTTAIGPRAAELLLRAKREKPRRSIRRLIKMLERAKVVRVGELSRSSVHRLLSRHGISGRPGREGVTKERRAWIAEHAGDLWVGDALHLRAPALAPDGRLRKVYLLSQIDSATRFIPHSFVSPSEGAVAQEHGLREAMLPSGRPRAYYVDRGSAYVAKSLRAICAELQIHLVHAGAGDGAAKGVIERWHRTWREEVEDELPAHPLPIAELNALHWAWLSREYHRREHDTTGRPPLEHWLAEAHHVRAHLPGKELAEVFLHREPRRVRKDATVKWYGRLLEVHWALSGQKVELRFDPTDHDALPRVFVDGAFVCDTVELDRVKNASRPRRRPRGEPSPDVEPTGLDPLRQMHDEHYGLSRPPGADDDKEN
jgi:transposase InsO family protein